MSHDANQVDMTLCDADAIEERRATRNLKHWMVKVLTLTFIAVFIVSVLSVLYTVVIQGKDMDTSFIAQMFERIFELLHFLLA